MKLYSYTLFLDILGYSTKIKHISKEESKNIFELLNNIEELITEYFNNASTSSIYKEYTLHYTFFSDCIILSFVPKDDINIHEDEIIFFNQTTLEFIFTWIVNVQFITLLKTGFLLRGGISCKDIYWSDNKVVGPALIEAYNLESKVASWARIVLSEELSNNFNLINHINQISKYSNSTYLPHSLLLKDDLEKHYYYNYIGRMLARLKVDNLSPENMGEIFFKELNENIPYFENLLSKEIYMKMVDITDDFMEEHNNIIIKNLEHVDPKIREKYIKLKQYNNKAFKDFIKLNPNFETLNTLIIN
ncbi:MAG: hypothetical protein WC145_03115 [Aliarcobacter sp.]